MNKNLIVIIAVVVVVGAVYLINRPQAQAPIGGDRDEKGCLIAAGYAYNEAVKACIREFEMTPDIMQAAQTAVEHVGESYGLTVTSFNSYEEVGAYDIFLEQGEDREQVKVEIRGGEVVDSRSR